MAKTVSRNIIESEHLTQGENRCTQSGHFGMWDSLLDVEHLWNSTHCEIHQPVGLYSL